MTEDDLTRFYTKVRLKGSPPRQIDPESTRMLEQQGMFDTDSCHIWNGRLNDYRTPMFDVGGKNHTARKVIYEHFNGPTYPFPNGQRAYVLRTCSEPLCVNPKHMYIGTNHERLEMMKAEERQRWAKENEK